MVETFGFFASAVSDEREYTQSDFAAYLGLISRNGVAPLFGNALAVTATAPSSMYVNVNTGGAIIEGYWYQNSASMSLQIPTADATQDRIDRVVLELKRASTRSIHALVVTGTPAGTPVAPDLVRDGETYQIGLATVTVPHGASVVTTIVDTRGTPATCGYVEPNRVSQASWYPTGEVDMHGQRVVNMAAPTANSHAATKLYTDTRVDWIVDRSATFAGDLKPSAGSPYALEDLGLDHSNPSTGLHIYGRRGTTGKIEWLWCNGAEVRKVAVPSEPRDYGYGDIFTTCGTAYGAATGGSLFFKLPDLRGRRMGFYSPTVVGYQNFGQYVPALSGDGSMLISHVVLGCVLIKT